MVSWGEHDAFFAMSEYGDVVYRLGTKGGEEDDWPIWKETIEEWRGEAGFLWSELAVCFHIVSFLSKHKTNDLRSACF